MDWQSLNLSLLSAVRIAPAAYVAGAECTLRHSPPFASLWSTAAALDAAWPLTRAIDDALARIRAVETGLVTKCPPHAVANVSPSVLPESAAGFVRAFQGGQLAVQSAIIHRISTLSHIARMTATGPDALTPADRARLLALTAKGSSRWLRVRPTDNGLSMTDLQWQTAAQLRLGMPRAPQGAAAPSCEHRNAADTDGWHALVCATRSGPAINARHHAVVRILADAARLLGVQARIEPHHLCAEDDSRPDIQLDLPDCTVLGDVTISHPLAARWQTKAAGRGVAAVGDARSAEKKEHYDAMAAAMGPEVKFLPFVLYTYGGLHQSATSFINLLGTAHDRAVALVSYADWKSDLEDRIAVSVQRHTADIVIQDTRRARSSEVAWRCRRRGRVRQRQRGPQPAAVPAAARSARGGGSRGSGSASGSVHGASSVAPVGRAASLCASLLACVPASSTDEDRGDAGGGAPVCRTCGCVGVNVCC